MKFSKKKKKVWVLFVLLLIGLMNKTKRSQFLSFYLILFSYIKVGVGRTRLIRPTRSSPPRTTPIRANLEEFLAYSGIILSKPDGSVWVSGI